MELFLDRIDWETVNAVSRKQQINREKHTPAISLFRWWARRPHALIGAILDAASEPPLEKFLVSDPFSGGGTVALEAARRGLRIYAQDLNPWATLGLSTALDGVDPKSLESATNELKTTLDEYRHKIYGSTCPDHGKSEIVHTFWARQVGCPHCSETFYIFPYSLLTVASRTAKERYAFFGCQACGTASKHKRDAKRAKCRSCNERVLEGHVPLGPQRNVSCPWCSQSSHLFELCKTTFAWKPILIQRLCTNDGRNALHFDYPRSKENLLANRHYPKKIPAPLKERIPKGIETRVLREAGFRRWLDLYPPRQLGAILHAAKVASGMDVPLPVRNRLLLAIVGSAEMAGYLCRWDRFYPKAFEAIANHRFSVVGMGVEINLLGSRGRGTIWRRLDSSVKAAQWSKRNMSKNPILTSQAMSKRRRWSKPPKQALVVTGSSERQLIPSGSARLVLTDPPYYDNVQYGELASLFTTWGRSVGLFPRKLNVDLSAEAVPNNARGTGVKDYERLLCSIFRETKRTLNPQGRVILTFRSTAFRAWVALRSALNEVGLNIVGLAVAHSENKSDHSKRGKRSFSRDLVIECSPKTNGLIQPAVVTPPVDDEMKELIAAGLAIATLGRGEYVELKEKFLDLLDGEVSQLIK